MSLHKDEQNQQGMKTILIEDEAVTILIEDEAVAPADRTDTAKDDDGLNPDGAVMQDDSAKKRSRKLTEQRRISA